METGKDRLDVHVHVHHHGSDSRFGRTRLGVCLDRSGSMEVIRDATISGFNEWLTDQKRLTTDAPTLTMVKFDTEYEMPYVNAALATVPPLTRDTFQPRGGTALNDAIVKTIQQLEKDLGGTADRAMVLILTDGEENSSREFPHVSAVRAMIQQKEATGRWTFVFLRGTLDQQLAFRQATSYGIQHGNTASYAPNAAGTAGAFAVASSGTANFRNSGQTNTGNFFDNPINPANATPTGLITGPVAQAMATPQPQAETAATAEVASAPEPATDNTTYTSE